MVLNTLHLTYLKIWKVRLRDHSLCTDSRSFVRGMLFKTKRTPNWTVVMDVTSLLVQPLQGGLGNLFAYLAAHVLLCLLPAFFIAGAMTALIPKETVTRFLGRNTPRFISYPAATLAG